MSQLEILGRLAVGGMAELFLARADDQPGPVVLKRGRRDADPRVDALLRTEAALTLPLHHANLIQTLALVEIAARPCLVLELVEGESLAAIQRARTAKPLAPALAAHLVREVAAGLAHAHAARPAVVHGDVNASNVLISSRGAVKLGDFGIAELAGTIRADGELRGQAGHVAPEVLRGAAADPRSDLFLLGLLLVELLQGGSVFASDDEQAALEAIAHFNPRQLERPELAPPALWKLALQLLQPDPDKRIAQVHEVLEALTEFAAPVGPTQVAALFSNALPHWRSPLSILDAPPDVAEARAPTQELHQIAAPVRIESPVRLESPTPMALPRFDSPTPPMGLREPLPDSPTPAHSFELEGGILTERLLACLEHPSDAGELIHLRDLELATLPLSAELLARLPRAWAERLNVIPVAASTGGLVVAMTEPEPHRLVTTLKSVSGVALVRGVLASPAAIRAAIERGYDAAGLAREPLLKL